MPAIWGVNNGYNVENKKVSSKITFKTGEKFAGKIVSKGEGNEATIRTADGWQFKAEIDGNVNLENGKAVKFQVEDLKDGKLKLKVVNDTVEQKVDSSKDNLQNIIKKEGLSKDDEVLLREMIKRDIPLTKENIRKFKSIIQFSEKLNIDPKESEAFIRKYMESKGIDIKSPEGQKIQNMLKEFMTSLKTMSKEDILLFLENNIDLTKENIDSFNKLFKTEGGVTKLFEELGAKLGVSDEIHGNNEAIIKNNGENISGKEALKDSKEGSIQKDLKTVENGKNIEVNSGKEINSTKTFEEVNLKGSDSTSNVASKLYEGNSKISVLELLKNIVNENGSKDLTNKVSDVVSNNAMNFDRDELNNIMSILSNTNDDEFIEMLKNSISTDKSIYQFTKSDLEEAFSKIFKTNISLSEGEFNNLKEVISGKVDLRGILTEENKNIFLEGGKNNSEVVQSNGNANGLEGKESAVIKETLANEVKNINDLVSPKVKEEIKDALLMKGLNSKDLVRFDADAKLDVMKEIINKALKGLDSGASEKVMQLIKENINDFKLFNSISNEYYYLDLPIHREDREYPCKLIIKDDRKDGKKIDKTNVKLVVSVKTVNIGMIDSFLSINNKNLKVELKCDNEYVTLIKAGKNALSDGLEGLGFFPSIEVSKKENELSLSTCREFFSDENNRALDITV